MIDRFFRPFLGGIFFDDRLGTSSRLFEFVMRCLATGANCLPAAGIGAVAEQLRARLPAGAVQLGERARPPPDPLLSGHQLASARSRSSCARACRPALCSLLVSMRAGLTLSTSHLRSS